jgi:hypothetical protein
MPKEMFDKFCHLQRAIPRPARQRYIYTSAMMAFTMLSEGDLSKQGSHLGLQNHLPRKLKP